MKPINNRSTTHARDRTTRVLATLALFALLLWVAAPAAAADRWFHVRVEEAHGAEVSVNLPLSLIEKAVDLVPADLSDEVELELNDAGFNVDDLRDLWAEVRNSGDATFLTVKEDDHTIEVRKEGDFFVAQTIGDSDTQFNVRFPLQVIDALFSAGPNKLDLGAAIRALADYGDGDMVTVRDGDTTVRVWVDDYNKPN